MEVRIDNRSYNAKRARIIYNDGRIEIYTPRDTDVLFLNADYVKTLQIEEGE
jgi:hypothetical protein